MEFIILTTSLEFNTAENILNKYPKLKEFDFIENIDNKLYYNLDNPNSLKTLIDEFAKDDIEIIVGLDNTGELIGCDKYYLEIYDDYR